MHAQQLLPDTDAIIAAAEELINGQADVGEQRLRRHAMACFAGRHMRSVMYLIEWLRVNAVDASCNIATFSETMMAAVAGRMRGLDAEEVVDYLVTCLKSPKSALEERRTPATLRVVHEEPLPA